MFAIIRVGGKQYRVENGTQILVDRLHVEEGNAVEGVEVLMLADGDDIQIGAPTLEVPVGVTALRHQMGKKIRVFKYKAKKNYRRRIGSRPHQTLIRVDSINGNSTRSNNRASNAATPEVAATPAAAGSGSASTATVPEEVVAVIAEPAVAQVAAVVETPVIVQVAPDVAVATVIETPVVAEIPVVVETTVVAEVPAETEEK